MGQKGATRNDIQYISYGGFYIDQIEAENEEEALDKFEAECPYDIDGNTIECECECEKQTEGSKE